MNHEFNQHIGKIRGGNTTKIHAIVDGLGNPVYFQLSSGYVNDNTLAVEMLSKIEIKDSNISGDKHTEQRKYIVSQEVTYTIPNNAIGIFFTLY